MTLATFLRYIPAVCAAFFAGCAAVQIDVDVYKGPLVNEQEIQLRQFAALAIAAKPMLASVRNELEEAAGGHVPHGSDDFVDSPTLRSDLARFVNGAMLSYWDLGSEAGNLLERGRERTRKGLETFRDYQPGDIAFAKALRDATSGSSVDPRRIELAKQYRILLCGGKGNIDCLAPPTPAPPSAFYRWTGEFPTACTQAFPPPARVCPDSERSNSVYLVLSDRSIVEKHALFLFGDDKHEGFVDRIVEIAKSYLELREGMRDVMEGALGLTDDLAPGKTPAKPLQDNLPQVIAFSVQPRTLACALTTPNAKRVSDAWNLLPEDAQRQLRSTKIASSLVGPQLVLARTLPVRHADQPVEPSPNDKDGRWTNDRYNEAQAAMTEVARDYPVQFADFLRVVDHEIAVLPEKDVVNCYALTSERDWTYVTPSASRRYGLASAPSDPETSNFVFSFPQMEQSSVLISKAQSVGFDQARLPLGIEHLTRDFLKALDDNEHKVDSSQVRQARQRLEESLIFFAERMLFVVNTVTKTAIEHDMGARPDMTNAASQVRNDGVHSYAGLRAERVDRLVGRTAVLQSLGNSLVLQANDLRRQLNHSIRQESRLQGEIDATRRALNPGAPAVFDALMLQAKADLARQAAAADRVKAAESAATMRSTDAGKAADTAEAAAKAASEALSERARAFKPLESLVRTYVPANDRGSVYPQNAKADPSEGNDQVRLQKSLEASFPTADDVTSNDYLNAIRDWLRLTSSGLGGTGARYERLTSALAYLNDAASPLTATPPPAGKRGDLDKTIRELLMDWASDQAIQLATLAAEARTKAQAANTASAKFAKAQAQVRAKAAAAPAAAAPSPEPSDILKVLTDRRADVLAEAATTTNGDPASLIQILARRIKDLPKQTVETSAAQTFLANFQPPPVTAYSLPPDWKGKTATDVYDQLIAQLRQARIQAELNGLTQQSTNVQRAINLAYEARSGVAFLRPASDYLKSVYSSTNLQTADDPAQKNLLDAWWQRTMFAKWGENKYELEARQQAEKLYWQNINRVSLSGGGRTNYVIAKDDIGNWYVKAYSADPGPIIRSAQNLALFSSGQKLNVNLLNRVDIQRQLTATKDPVEKDKLRGDLTRHAAEGNASLLKVHDRYAAQYVLALTQAAQSLQLLKDTLIPGIKKTVADAFPAETTKPDAAQLGTGLASALTEFSDAVARLDPALKLADTDATRLGKIEDAVFNSLDALRRYRRSIYGQMNANSTTGMCSAELATCTKAASVAQGYVKDQLTAIATPYRSALATYDNALFNLEDIATSQ